MLNYVYAKGGVPLFGHGRRPFPELPTSDRQAAGSIGSARYAATRIPFMLVLQEKLLVYSEGIWPCLRDVSRTNEAPVHSGPGPGPCERQHANGSQPSRPIFGPAPCRGRFPNGVEGRGAATGRPERLRKECMNFDYES